MERTPIEHKSFVEKSLWLRGVEGVLVNVQSCFGGQLQKFMWCNKNFTGQEGNNSTLGWSGDVKRRDRVCNMYVVVEKVYADDVKKK